MREIKFRVWLEEMKTMQYSDKLSSFFKDYESTRRPMMQYIGSNDKNGTEIYDGDILKDEYDRIMLVKWHNSGFCFKAITETNFEWAGNISQWFEGGTPPIIIGNCYENPELLEE